jgi:hypothetical protein
LGARWSGQTSDAVRPLVSDAIDLLSAPLVQHRVTRVDEHRPWPMPQRHWLMAQT